MPESTRRPASRMNRGPVRPIQRQADLSLSPPVAQTAHRNTALGLVCTHSFPAVVGTADMMLKSAGVTLVGYEKTGDGYCTAVVRGKYADVKLAVEIGVDTAKKFEQYVSSMMLPRPLPNLDAVLPITEHFAEYVERAGDFEARGAIGLIETTGFPAMVGAADAAMKCANVELITYETTGAGLCTAVIQGPIADVTMAVEAGMQAAERIGDLHAIMVIPRPLDDLMKVMPKPPHWVAVPEAPQPLELPERAPDRIALPELERVRVPVEIPVERVDAELEARDWRQPLEFDGPEILRSPEASAEAEGNSTENISSSINSENSSQPLFAEELSPVIEVQQASLPLPTPEPLRLDSAKPQPTEEDS